MLGRTLFSGGSAPEFMLLAAGDGAVEGGMWQRIADVLTLIQPPLLRENTPKKRLPEPLRLHHEHQ
jgi:hypothetical protein